MIAEMQTHKRDEEAGSVEGEESQANVPTCRVSVVVCGNVEWCVLMFEFGPCLSVNILLRHLSFPLL
jgi:hypothetical protein